MPLNFAVVTGKVSGLHVQSCTQESIVHCGRSTKEAALWSCSQACNTLTIPIMFERMERYYLLWKKLITWWLNTVKEARDWCKWLFLFSLWLKTQTRPNACKMSIRDSIFFELSLSFFPLTPFYVSSWTFALDCCCLFPLILFLTGEEYCVLFA